MTIEELKYPVLCFSQGLVRVRNAPDGLTTCSKLALRKGGYFSDLFLVDSLGVGLRITGAQKLHGVGPFWGYNIFLNQRIKVRLLIAGAPVQVSVAEVKALVLNSFQRWHGWQTRGDFEGLRAAVARAATIPEIAQLLSEDHAHRQVG